MKKMKRVVFILDRVTLYQKELLQRLEVDLKDIDIDLHLFAGQSKKIDLARRRVTEKVIQHELAYDYYELKISSFTFRYQKSITALIKEVKPNIIIMSSHVGNISSWSLMKLKEELGFKLVSWQCGYEYNPSRIKSLLLNKFIQNFDYHLAYHNNAKKYALNYSAKNNQIKVIHNTINETSIKSIDKTKAREQLNETLACNIKNKKILLYVGAILKEKKLDILCNAFKQLTSTDSLLIIVGDGPYLEELKERFKQQVHILFIGSVFNDIGLYFDSADIFVLPGTGGLAINEAMAHGLPVISGYADGSADDLVIDNENGLRLNNVTVTEVATKITTLLNSPETLKQMGHKSQQMINTKYTYDKFIGRIITTLEILVK